MILAQDYLANPSEYTMDEIIELKQFCSKFVDYYKRFNVQYKPEDTHLMHNLFIIYRQAYDKIGRMEAEIKMSEPNQTEEPFADVGKEERILSWEEADIASSKFVRFETDREKLLTIQNWRVVERPDRFDPDSGNKIYFYADVTEEDGTTVNKVLDSPSMRLRAKMRPVLEGQDPTTPFKVSITRVGDKFDTAYLVKAV